MTPAETITILRQFNEWRQGDEDLPQPNPKQITAAIYAAIEMIEKAGRIEDAATNLVRMKGRHHTEIAYQRLEEAVKELRK